MITTVWLCIASLCVVGLLVSITADEHAVLSIGVAAAILWSAVTVGAFYF